MVQWYRAWAKIDSFILRCRASTPVNILKHARALIIFHQVNLKEVMSKLYIFCQLLEVNYLEKKFRTFTQRGKYFSWNQYSFVCAQCWNWNLRNFPLVHFCQKFRETNSFNKEITKELIWRFIFSVRVNFSFFHTVLLE